MERLDYPALGETVYRETLPNGLQIFVAKKPGFRKAFAMFAANYGGADRRYRLGGEWTDTPAGVAHFLEHKMFDMPDGTNVLAQLSARGAAPNAYTSAGITAYHFTCTDGFGDNLRTLLRFVSTPWYTPESVAKEQGIIAQEILMYENNPASAGYHALMELLFPNHPIREAVAGTVESIARITPEILYGCHRAFYRPSNMALCCVGDIDPQAVADTAAELLPPQADEIPERDHGAENPLFPETDRAERVMAVSAPLFYLGSSLPAAGEGKEKLRRQLLCELSLEYLAGPASGLYTELYAQGLLNRDFGTACMSSAGAEALLMGGESRDPQAVFDALTERIDRIARRGVDGAAFERCRRARFGAELSGLDAFSAYARAMAEGAFQGWAVDDVFTILPELTAEDAAEFLCENVSPRRMAMSVVRPG